MEDKNKGYEFKKYSMNIYEYEPIKKKQVEYYRKIEKTTTKTISNITNSHSREYTSLTNKSYSRAKEYEKGNEHERGNIFISNQRESGKLKGNRSFSSNQKQKYTYQGKIREKNNYVYYVSGIGYLNKNEENKNQEKKEVKVIKAKPKPKPQVQPRPRPETIVIRQQKEDTGEKELVDNYQYHETKDIKQENKKTLVTHQRLCEPFYHTVRHSTKKRYSSYTEQPKFSYTSSMRRSEYEVAEPTKTIQNVGKGKFNYRTQKIPGGGKYDYFSSKQGSHSSKNYNYNSNSFGSFSSSSHTNYQKYSKKDNSKTGLYRRRDDNEGKKNILNGIPKGNTNYKNIYEKKFEERRKNNYDNVYNNINRHEIKVTSKGKNIKENKYKTNVVKTHLNINETKKYIPQVVREHKVVERKKYNNINKKNVNSSKTENISQEIKKKYGQKVIKKTKEVYENRKYYPIQQINKTEHVYQYKKIEQNIPHHTQQIALYEREQKGQKDIMIPQQVHKIEINEKVVSQNIPQNVQQIQVNEEKEIKSIPQQNIQVVKTEEVVQENQGNVQQISQEKVEVQETEEVYQENLEQAPQNIEVEHESVEQTKEVFQENMVRNAQENEEAEVEQNDEEVQENQENMEQISQENVEHNENEEEHQQEYEEYAQQEQEQEQHEEAQNMNQEEQITQKNVTEVVQQTKEVEQEGNEEHVQENGEEQDQEQEQEEEQEEEQEQEGNEEQDNVEQLEEEEEDNQEENGEVIDEEENIQQTEEVNQEEKEEVIEEEKMAQAQTINSEEREIIKQENIQHDQQIYQQQMNQYIPQNAQQMQIKQIIKEESTENTPQGKLEQQNYIQYIPTQNDQNSKNIYQEEKIKNIPHKNIQQIREEFEEEREEYNPEQNDEEMYQEETRQYIPQQNIQQVKEIYQEERRYIPQRDMQNINAQEMIQGQRRQFIPQQYMDQREEIYQMQRRQYNQQLNNNQNYINIGRRFCPIHGIYGHGQMKEQRFGTTQGFEQRQIVQEDNRNNSSHQRIIHTHEEMDGILSEANNYKFYESKNIKNTEENSNCITLHFTRGVDEKDGNNRGGSYYSNVYVATKSVPVSDSNTQQYQSFNQTNASYNNFLGEQSHIHSQHGFCPIHNNNNIKRQQGY